MSQTHQCPSLGKAAPPPLPVLQENFDQERKRRRNFSQHFLADIEGSSPHLWPKQLSGLLSHLVLLLLMSLQMTSLPIALIAEEATERLADPIQPLAFDYEGFYSEQGPTVSAQAGYLLH